MSTSYSVDKSYFCYSRFFTAALLFLISLGAAYPVTAQQTDADFSAYCRANFNNSAYQKFAQSWGTEHACVQGGTRQGIDLAEACLLTTGSRSYEISGQRVLCDGNAGDAPAANTNDTGEPDFSRYCNENFPNSAYETHAESSGVKHYCRRPGATGGFTLQPVDLAVACQISQGVSQYRIAGARVFCTAGNRGARNGVDGGGGGGGGGNGDGGASAVLDGLTAETTQQVACASLGGNWHGGTLELVNEISQQIKTQLLSQCTDASVNCPTLRAELGEQGYLEVAKIFQCHLTFIQSTEGKTRADINQAITEACEIEPILNGYWDFWAMADRSVFGTPPHYKSGFDQSQMAELCTCEPTNIPDFAARVEELKQQAARKLIAEFSQ